MYLLFSEKDQEHLYLIAETKQDCSVDTNNFVVKKYECFTHRRPNWGNMSLGPYYPWAWEIWAPFDKIYKLFRQNTLF